MGRIARATEHPVLTARLTESARLTLLSGHAASKPWGKEGRPPCPKCKARSLGRVENTMEHALHECPARIWETTMGCWEKLTGEHLDHKDVRVTLLGDRRSASDILPITAREEMFRALHASTLHALVENWRQQRHATKPKRRDTRTTLQRARRVLDDTVRTRWRALRRAGKEEEFHDTWVLSGAAV